ncbi:LysR family transcriptional regulator [Caulobacter vibrioides]|uniref:Transcriptional regulator, LysR family n=3 Tax=Pseudomonadota TaxID=1224 RepID=Q9A7U8_CAUVC|nr:LysR family transcriptional regulator [Caulobacter vibrioides]YP_002517066.1 LysR-family transcriptional regulator [Caulobacter vibrioides NA1000]AAK23600.1 transcriptional regulator, LysR family [Caulobacter vibrioides CB15]ACL95158.1 LysR-family transcriptional regulator [Caulobacter vibrioides NA1000]ATC24631.1 LysR family transcriptional regulator [Caulobacter vibrioides]ATC28505.1 LysR family transcriptional regulator [Caulobacter vibrioides]AZH12769.1 LysR family transcriptional regu
MKLNLRSLEAFRETMLSGSATAAAGRMGLTQPAVSRLIAQLEQEVGFELFYRERGRLSPTPEALIIYDEIDLAFGGLERVDALARDIAAFNTGLLKIVAPPSLSESVLSTILPRFMARFPKVRIAIESRSTATARAMVANRTVDCGFVKLPLDRSDISTVTLSTSETVCVLPDTHPLTAHEVLTPELLRGEPLVLLGAGTWTRRQIDDAFRERGVRPDVRVETHTVGSACALAAGGLGVAIVNALLADNFARPGVAIRVFRPQILHEYAFMTSALAPMNRLAAAFLEEAQTFFREQAR